MSYNADRRRVLGRGLKAARMRVSLSAAGASELITAKGVKCTSGTLLAWERGKGVTSREPFASDLLVIASVYGCSLNDFFQRPEAGNGDGQLIQPSLEPRTERRSSHLPA